MITSFYWFAYQGLWHIPAEEIDRPGSFATHLYRAARLTQVIATHQQDHEILVQIGTQSALDFIYYVFIIQ